MAAAALSTLGLASPVVRQSSVSSYYLHVNSLDSSKYEASTLSTCHTAAAEECLCYTENSTPPTFTFGEFTGPFATSNLFYNGTNNGFQNQGLAFLQNGTFPGVSYGFFGGGDGGEGFGFNAHNSQEILSWWNGSFPSSDFYMCPEYVDYDHEGYATLSVIAPDTTIPSDCDRVQVYIQNSAE